jgi:hypothetical protein
MPAYAELACTSRAHPRCRSALPFGVRSSSFWRVVLAPERVRLIADSGAVGGTHSTGCRARFCSFAVGAGGLRAGSCCCARNGTSGRVDKLWAHH